MTKRIRVNAGHDEAEEVVVQDPQGRAFMGVVEKARVRKVVTQTLLDRYKRRGLITEKQWLAGDKFRADLYRAGMLPKMTVPMDKIRVDGGGGRGDGDARLNAQDAIKHALRGVPQRLSGILVAVCADAESAAAHAAREGHRGRTAEIIGMERLRCALDALAEMQ